MIEIKAYRCSHCPRHYRLMKSAIVRHEAHCHWHPANKSCITCSHLHRGQDEVCFDGHDISVGNLRNACLSHRAGKPIITEEFHERNQTADTPF